MILISDYLVVKKLLSVTVKPCYNEIFLISPITSAKPRFSNYNDILNKYNQIKFVHTEFRYKEVLLYQSLSVEDMSASFPYQSLIGEPALVYFHCCSIFIGGFINISLNLGII